MSSTRVFAPNLSPGQKVAVRNVHTGMLPATVDRADAATLVVVLAVRDDRMSRLIGHEMAIEATSSLGIHRYSGVLASEQGGSLSISLTGDVERIQRREFVRVAAVIEVSIAGLDEEDVGGATTTLDLSGSGMRIVDRFDLPLGIDVRIVIQLPEGEPVTALGRVVRVGSESDQKGIRFDSIPRVDEDRLMRYIRNRELQALRASRG